MGYWLQLFHFDVELTNNSSRLLCWYIYNYTDQNFSLNITCFINSAFPSYMGKQKRAVPLQIYMAYMGQVSFFEIFVALYFPTCGTFLINHYGDDIMSAIASQITSLTIVCSAVYPHADQGKHQSSASLAFVRGIHRRPVNSPHKGPVTRKMFPFDDVIMYFGWQVVQCPWPSYTLFYSNVHHPKYLSFFSKSFWNVSDHCIK